MNNLYTKGLVRPRKLPRKLPYPAATGSSSTLVIESRSVDGEMWMTNHRGTASANHWQAWILHLPPTRRSALYNIVPHGAPVESC